MPAKVGRIVVLGRDQGSGQPTTPIIVIIITTTTTASIFSAVQAAVQLTAWGR